jgi:hypothetical protein
MSTRIQRTTAQSLKLPPEFEDLTGVIQNDLKVIVSILSERADQRLLLSRRQAQQLRRKLWDSLVGSINSGLEPLTVEHR